MLVGEGDHIAKQDVTLWAYNDQKEVSGAVLIKRYEFVEVLIKIVGTERKFNVVSFRCSRRTQHGGK